MCDLSAGRGFQCKDQLGGIKEILWCKHSDIDFDAIASGAVTDITSTTTLYRWVVNRNSGSFNQPVQSNVENGSVFFTQELNAQIHKMTATINAEQANAMRNRLCIIVRDSNDNFHVMGYKNGAEASGGGINTGQATGDLSGYVLAFNAEEKDPAPFAPNLSDATVVSGLTGTLTIDPAY